MESRLGIVKKSDTASQAEVGRIAAMVFVDSRRLDFDQTVDDHSREIYLRLGNVLWRRPDDREDRVQSNCHWDIVLAEEGRLCRGIWSWDRYRWVVRDILNQMDFDCQDNSSLYRLDFFD